MKKIFMTISWLVLAIMMLLSVLCARNVISADMNRMALLIGTILMAVSLFWLGLSQLSHLRPRILILILGVLIYIFGLAWSLGVEGIFFFIRRGG